MSEIKMIAKSDGKEEAIHIEEIIHWHMDHYASIIVEAAKEKEANKYTLNSGDDKNNCGPQSCSARCFPIALYAN